MVSERFPLCERRVIEAGPAGTAKKLYAQNPFIASSAKREDDSELLCARLALAASPRARRFRRRLSRGLHPRMERSYGRASPSVIWVTTIARV